MPGYVKTCAAVLGVLSAFVASPPALAQTMVTPTASFQTANAVDQDDMCLWIHPTDRSLSTVIASDKSANALFVYDLAGALVQEIPLPGRPGNIDVRYGFPFRGELADIVVFNDRDTNRLRVYQVDPVTRMLTQVDDNASALGDNYGSCLYRSPATGQYYAFTTSETGVVNQYLLEDAGGLVTATLVRSWNLGGPAEGCVADDETGYAYFAEEGRGIWKIGADPDASAIPHLIAEVGDGSGLAADVEGLTMYYAANGEGYLFASSRLQAEFIVYERRDPHDFVKSFTIEGVSGTDGIDVTNVDLGPAYRAGIFAAQSASGDPKPVHVCRYEDLGLPVDAWYWDPRNADPGSPGDLGVHPSGYAEMGWRDFDFGADVYYQPTAEKPERKLWWHDGTWWGVLWDPAASSFRIARYDESRPSWTFTGPDVDPRSFSLSDVLSEGNTLYIASHARKSPGGPTYLYRYTYDEPTGLYSLDAGFPAEIDVPKVEALTITKDTAGRLWATYEKNDQIWITASAAGDDALWSAPTALPVSGSTVDGDDISAIVAFDGKVGVVWSNQIDGTTYFAWRNDTDPDDVWNGPEVALNGSGGADDHLSITSFEDNVFIVVRNAETVPTEPLVYVLKRDPAGIWMRGVVGTKAENHTRPTLVIDEDHREVFVFAKSDEGTTGDIIWMKVASVDDLDFGPGLGAAFIRSSNDHGVNNPTATKQNVNRETGLLVLASDSSTDRYLHGFLRLDGDVANVPPVAVAAATPGTGIAPVTIQFTSVGSFDPDGMIASYWWDFGDGFTSTLPDPQHVYGVAGTHIATLTVRDERGVPSSATVEVIIDPPTGVALHVDKIDLSHRIRAGRNEYRAVVTIVDMNGLAIPGAIVTGTWTGSVSATFDVVTEEHGLAIYERQKTTAMDEATFCVTSVAHPDYEYDNAANVETCKTIAPAPPPKYVKGEASPADDPGGETLLGPGGEATVSTWELGQNRPNPFRGRTEIRFSLARSEHVSVVIYNTLGQEVRRLVDGRFGGGQHRVEWDGRDSRGQHVAPGVYLYRMTSESQRTVRKMSVLR